MINKINMKYKILMLLILSTMLLNCSSQKPLKFVLLNNSKEYASESNNKITFWGATYLIENYHNNKYNSKQIDSFALQLGKLKIDSCDSYVISFYNASEITDLEHIIKQPKDLDWYYMNYQYRWNNRIFLGRTKFRHGKIIYPKSTVKIKDAPPLRE